MRLGRYIFGCAFALMLALAAQPAFAQKPKGPKAAARQARIEARQQAKNQNANKPKQNGNNAGGNAAIHNGTGNGAGSGANGGNGGPAPRPPNEQAFKPNPNVAHPGEWQSFSKPNNLPPGAEQRLRDMSPQEQERFLQNNQRFQSLPPAEQARIRQNLQKWNSLSPAEKDRMDHVDRFINQMTPQKRDLYQNHILPKWQQMTPDRRQLINGRLHTLQAMPPEAQQRALNDPKFMQGLSPDEQDTLRNLVSLRNPNP